MCWARERRPERLRATYRRTHGIGYLFGSYDLDDDRLHGSYRRSRSGADFLGFLSEAWLPDNNARLVLLPTYSSWLNRIEGHFAALRSFVISGSDYPDHETIERELLRYIDWRNQHRHDPKLRQAEKRGCFH